MKRLTVVTLALLAGSLVFLPQCELMKKEEKPSTSEEGKMPEAPKPTPSSASSSTAAPSSEVLLTLYDEKVPKLTITDFQNYKKELLEAQPNYASVIEFMPGANEQIFESLVNETLLEEWAKKNKVDQLQAYKDDLDKIMKYARRSLNVKYFQEKHPVAVTDAEVKKYYEDNKNSIPQLMITQGGVAAKMVSFPTKAEAQAFYEKVKDPKTNFDAVAKEQNLTIKDLGEVNNQSFDVDANVRKKLLEMKKFPSPDNVFVTELNDKTFAVVKALSKTEPKYVPFEQVKAGIENLLKQQKAAEVLTKELDKLKKEYKAVTNKDYFERERKVQEENAQKIAESIKKEQEKAGSKEETKMPAPVKSA